MWTLPAEVKAFAILQRCEMNWQNIPELQCKLILVLSSLMALILYVTCKTLKISKKDRFISVANSFNTKKKPQKKLKYIG